MDACFARVAFCAKVGRLWRGMGDLSAADVITKLRVLILVVDRDPHVRAVERYFLEDAGYAVEVAADGEEGLSRTRELLPAIVISEILLPRRDGLSICRAVKEDDVTKHIPVLLFSILSAADRALAAGADAFLSKPLDERRLVATIQALLGTEEGGANNETDPQR